MSLHTQWDCSAGSEAGRAHTYSGRRSTRWVPRRMPSTSGTRSNVFGSAARATQLARDGLRISSPHGDFSVAVRTIDLASIRESFDLVLLAVKSYSLAAAMNDLDPAIGPASAILPVINGMAHIEALSARFGANRILGGVGNYQCDPGTGWAHHSIAACPMNSSLVTGR